MTNFVTSWHLDETLRRAGFPLPANCREARLTFGIDSAIMLTYDVFLTPDNLRALAKAFEEMARVHEGVNQVNKLGEEGVDD